MIASLIASLIAALIDRLPGRRPLRIALALRALAGSVGMAGAMAVAAVALPPQDARAQTRPKADPEGTSAGEIKAQREFRLLDMNGDNQLSRSEVRLFPRLAQAFDEADTDHNGYVSYEEVRAFAAKVRAERDRQRAAQAANAPASPAPPASEPGSGRP